MAERDRTARELEHLVAARTRELKAANRELQAQMAERARVEMLWLCAAAYGLLPALNALTTSRHLGHSIPRGDWIMAGFDLAALGCAAIAVLCAVKVKRSQAGVTVRRRPRTAATVQPQAS